MSVPCVFIYFSFQSIAVYAADAGHQEAANLAKDISSKLDLNPDQKAKLTSALGNDIIDV